MNRDEIIEFLSTHKADFEQKFGLTKLGIFGSYARDEHVRNSDIDIVVELKNLIFFF